MNFLAAIMKGIEKLIMSVLHLKYCKTVTEFTKVAEPLQDFGLVIFQTLPDRQLFYRTEHNSESIDRFYFIQVSY